MASGGQAAGALQEARELVSDLCRHFYTLGWVSGTGGSISLRIGLPSDPPESRLIVMAPSGVQKERMQPEDMYVLTADGSPLEVPLQKPYPAKKVKCSDCHPLFLEAFTSRGAGACIHSHGMESALVTMIHPGATEFRITHMEMIKGINGHGYRDTLVVPIIENTPSEGELTASLKEAIAKYPKTTAVLVRNHGVYIWGDNWVNAKTQAECYHYLFDAAVRLHQLGLDPADPSHRPVAAHAGAANGIPSSEGRKRRRTEGGKAYPAVIVLDIEGTTTPISFVADVLFPYAKQHVGAHLRDTYDTPETQDDIRALRQQVEADLAAGVAGAVPVPPETSGRDAVVAALEKNVLAAIAADRKITALKQLQGHIWRGGYEKGELRGAVFEDVPTALADWTEAGSKVYIYSSGSREAQRLIFGFSTAGDLRPFLSGYFDTTTGPKREARSYSEIALSVGVDSPADITFATDILQEAQAARQAGLNAVLLERPGNGALPSEHGFRVVKSLLEI
ncbi:Class II aldolase [Klebsormidium nitens]|uniref:Probable bifunctional methylthioribulose-1-phosphate dehydratase/enolase-phosphatase E1 n=1 Tax=Klebsormidium nitens TaxID=105231 RepID=A0A1Y1IP99_KLENI|nr:Class II aldolase [Klebsormidium nitens]|eukprot:GAQ92473.1 Class II aldolase [Klebsormidium nitens]